MYVTDRQTDRRTEEKESNDCHREFYGIACIVVADNSVKSAK